MKKNGMNVCGYPNCHHIYCFCKTFVGSGPTVFVPSSIQTDCSCIEIMAVPPVANTKNDPKVTTVPGMDSTSRSHRTSCRVHVVILVGCLRKLSPNALFCAEQC